MASPVPLDPLFVAFQTALAGRYSIEREIGRGGMGVVYLAREVHLDRPVAIKLLPPERAADDAVKDRFLREARLAAKLSHPNVIPIHAVAETGGFVFYVMAYVDGETLAQRVRSRGPLSTTEGTRIVQESAWALAHAHEHGLIHRDVKPDNILLERGSGRALVADFGIAAAVADPKSSGEHGVAGTPEFMSPEQALGDELDPRSDLYSLGATAFFAFSGRIPFEGTTATEVLAKHVTEPAPSLATLGLSVPRKVAQIVDRCLAKDREQRPPSAGALAEQLGVALEQRRELPAALRGFVKRTGRAEGIMPILLPNTVLVASIAVGTISGTVAGWSLFVGGMVAVPFGMMVAAARRIAKLGFAHQDLEPAFRDQLETSREEFAAVATPKRSEIERVLKIVAATSGPVAIATLARVVWISFLPAHNGSALEFTTMATLWAIFGTIAIGSTIGFLTLMQRRKDIDIEFYAKLWRSRLGRLAFGVARRLVRRDALGAAMTHRPTELSLGLASENLYEALPRETRAALADVPATLARLQADAQTLRRHVNALNDSLADAGTDAAAAEYADVRELRDQLQDKLAESVGALETIRLNLLRLHAGSGSVEGLTTHLGIAAEVSEAVARLVAAKADVERALRFPREIASTPV